MVLNERSQRLRGRNGSVASAGRSRRILGGLGATLGLLAAMTAGACAQTLAVRLTGFGDPGVAYVKKTIVPAFEKAHPGVAVEITTDNWDGRFDKLTAEYAAGTLPDVLQLGSEDIGMLAPAGLIQPLGQYADKWDDLKDFPQVELDDGTFEGQLWDIPYGLDQRTLTYRKDLFAKAGLTPEAPDTWPELAATAQKLAIKSADGKWVQAGITIFAHAYVYDNLLFEAGGSFLSEDLRRVTVGDPPAVEAAQFMDDLVNKYGVSPPVGHGWIGDGAAMAFAGFWAVTTKSPGVDIGVALPPMGPAKRTSAIHVNKWAISSTAKDPDLAWDWIAFVSSAENMAALSRVRGTLPPRRSMLNVSPWSDDPGWRTLFQAVGLSTPYRAKVPTFQSLLWDKDKVPGVLADILNVKKPAASALPDLARRVQVDLDAFWKGYDAHKSG